MGFLWVSMGFLGFRDGITVPPFSCKLAWLQLVATAGNRTDVLLIFKGKRHELKKFSSTTIWVIEKTSPWEMAHKNAHCFIATVYLLKIW